MDKAEKRWGLIQGAKKKEIGLIKIPKNDSNKFKWSLRQLKNGQWKAIFKG